jgi:hypothetical protein
MDALTLVEFTFQQTLQGQPCFNVFIMGAEENIPDAEYQDELTSLLTNLTDFWEDLGAFQSQEYKLNAISYRRLISKAVDEDPVWDIPDVRSYTLTGDLDPSADDPLPANSALYVRFTTDFADYPKRSRGAKYFTGFTESNQDDGVWLNTLVSGAATPLNSWFCAQVTSENYSFRAGLIPKGAAFGALGLKLQTFANGQINTLVTHQDRRRRGTARGGYFAVG